MKQINIAVIIIGILLSSLGCKNTIPTFDPNLPNQKYIHFGSGGGFTGRSTHFYLLESGRMWTKKDSIFELVKTIDEKNADQMFAIYRINKMEEIQYNNPKNLYKFIEYVDNNTSHKIQWGEDLTTYPIVDTYYKVLLSKIK